MRVQDDTDQLSTGASEPNGRAEPRAAATVYCAELARRSSDDASRIRLSRFRPRSKKSVGRLLRLRGAGPQRLKTQINNYFAVG